MNREAQSLWENEVFKAQLLVCRLSHLVTLVSLLLLKLVYLKELEHLLSGDALLNSVHLLDVLLLHVVDVFVACLFCCLNLYCLGHSEALVRSDCLDNFLLEAQLDFGLGI